MSFWTYENLAKTAGGTWRIVPDDPSAVLPAAMRDAGAILCHDTRELTEGQCYLAIKGENFDGHGFVEDAFTKGAALAIVDAGSARSAIRHLPSPILEVEDTIKALQDLARAYRDDLASGGCKVIGVAGSNGKTTTRHLIHHVLTHAGKRGTQSPKSFNNHLGVPLSLLAARPGDDFVACEIGTNHPGEINFLSAIARPDIAVITSIGEEHLEFFGDIKGVMDEELSIIEHIKEDGHLVAGHLSNAIGYEQLATQFARGHVVFHHYAEEENEPPHKRLLKGEHNRVNAAIAGGVAKICGARFPDWYEALKTAQPPPHRCEAIRFGSDMVVVDDCYNANPSSMMAALCVLGEEVRARQGSRGVAILGDMFELGEHAADGHREVAEFARDVDCAVDQMITVGEYAETMADSFDAERSIAFPRWSDDLPDNIAALLQPGDTVLLKASRGMRLERLIPAIEARFGKADDSGL